MPSAPSAERGEDAIIALADRLHNVLQPATVSDILAESALPPDPLAPPAAFGCLGCGGLRELKQVPCSCGALSTRRILELPGGPAVTKWKRFVLTNFAQMRAAWEDLPPLLCFSSLLATYKWVTTFVDPKHRRKVKAGQYLSIPLPAPCGDHLVFLVGRHVGQDRPGQPLVPAPDGPRVCPGRAS